MGATGQQRRRDRVAEARTKAIVPRVAAGDRGRPLPGDGG